MPMSGEQFVEWLDPEPRALRALHQELASLSQRVDHLVWIYMCVISRGHDAHILLRQE